MPWQITNQQQDPMTLALDGGGSVNLPGQGNVTVDAGVATITYHRLLYTRVGDWVFSNGTDLAASYPGGQNIELKAPDQSTMIFQYNGP